MTSRTTVLAVVGFLGAFALAALASVTWLLHDGTDPTVVAVVATPMGMALGGLTGLLASTRSTLGPKDTEPTTFQATVARPDPYDVAVDKVAP